jgi:WD40 repeat protein
MQVVQLFSCVDKISSVEWAPDSEYILCGLYKRPMVQAWSLSQPDWTCKIDEGPAGIAYARWSPDSRHILTTSEFQLRLTVWSLVNTACVHVQWPKNASRGVSFTKDGKFAAICTRRDCKDYINLLSCQSWKIMGVFAVDTVDLAGVEWSPDDSSIVVWDSLLEYKVHVPSFWKLCIVVLCVMNMTHDCSRFICVSLVVLFHIHSCHIIFVFLVSHHLTRAPL